jgi:hypothetical protein
MQVFTRMCFPKILNIIAVWDSWELKYLDSTYQKDLVGIRLLFGGSLA